METGIMLILFPCKSNILQADSVFSGISTFGRLSYSPCLSKDHENFDIAFIGWCLREDRIYQDEMVHPADLDI